MKIINLMEDTLGEKQVYAEHGFSIYIETPRHRLLADTGVSEKTWENAKRLGVDLGSIDLVFLSHGHYDHSGGILSFAEQNPDVRIYMHARAVHEYYNLKDGREKYIGIDPRIRQLPQVVLLEGDCGIDPELSIFSGVTGRRKWPKSNLTLKRKTENGFVQDSFDHEQYIVVKSEGKRILISGCAHNGILNILDRFRELAGQGAGVLLITHDLELAITAASRLVVLNQGRTVEELPAARFQTGEGLAHPYTRALWRAMPRNGFEA